MNDSRSLPIVVQGGMGVGVSNWRLARAVSMRKQLGVVSGTALDTILVRRLQDGDADAHVRRAMQAFPIAGVADAVLARYFIRGGRAPDAPYAMVPMYRRHVSVERQQLTMLANFVEVFLAKEGHTGVVGTNLLTKLQLPNLASLYGAMLAGVDYVLMGAGIPREIPAALDALALHQTARLSFDVDGARGEAQSLTFDPVAHGGDASRPLLRPKFLAIVSSDTLAINLARKSSGYVDGFVVEGPTAGGHNAPPRGPLTLTERGEPVYGERDVVDIQKVRDLGRPFWLAGGTGSPAHVANALEAGAAGVQVGTLFAYCDESGFDATLKQDVLESAKRGTLHITTDPLASPTGYPFKVVTWGADAEHAALERERVCDLGYLRSAYQREDGRIGYRCAAEPVADYVRKGGDAADTVGRRCVCNGLVATVGMPQIREGRGEEPALVTSGDDLANIGAFLGDRISYAADDVLDYLLPACARSNRSAFITLDHAATNA